MGLRATPLPAALPLRWRPPDLWRGALHSHRVLLAVCAVPGALVLAASGGTIDGGTWPRAAIAIASALVVAATGAWALVAARRHPDTRSALMATAFLAMAVLLAARALALLPGALWSPGIARLTDVAVLPAGALVLGLSVAPELRQHRRLDLVWQSAIALAVFLASVHAIVFSAGDDVPMVPAPGGDAALGVFAGGAVLLLVLARRAARTAVLTRRGGDVAVTAGVVTAIFALWAITQSHPGDVLAWSGHALELAALTAICVPAVRDLRARGASRPLVGDLRAADIVADEVSFLDGRVHHLLLQLERKDDVTEGHTRRVAELAVRIGEQLGLGAASLRDLAAGGLLHDIGKLHTPDAILKKPAALTAAEYEIVKRHPADGRRILRAIGRFDERVLHLVDAHHERLDGRGYPHGRAGAAITLEARILAVADVYDALTSHRPYRVAWPADRALEVIERDAGSAYDPRCVAALRVVVGGPQLLPRVRRFQPGGRRTGV